MSRAGLPDPYTDPIRRFSCITNGNIGIEPWLSTRERPVRTTVPPLRAAAIASARKGGAVVLTGLSRMDNQGAVPMFPFVMQEKRLIGSVYGSGNPARDIPRLAALYEEGKLKLRELVSRTYPLSGINDALAALAASDGARGIIRW